MERRVCLLDLSLYDRLPFHEEQDPLIAARLLQGSGHPKETNVPDKAKRESQPRNPKPAPGLSEEESSISDSSSE